MSEGDEAFLERMKYEIARYMRSAPKGESQRLMDLARRGLDAKARNDVLDEAASVYPKGEETDLYGADGYTAGLADGIRRMKKAIRQLKDQTP